MTVRLLTAAVTAVAAAGVLAAPADAAPKTIKQSYDVSLPVPFPVLEGMADFNGCWNGEEGASRHTRTITLPATGVFKAQVDYNGDWDLYLFDAKGAMLAASENDDSGSIDPATEKFTWKRAKKGQKVDLVVCNWAGLKDAKVSYTFTYGK